MAKRTIRIRMDGGELQLRPRDTHLLVHAVRHAEGELAVCVDAPGVVAGTAGGAQPEHVAARRGGSNSLSEGIGRKTDLLKLPAFTKVLDRAKMSESFVFPFAYRVLRLENAARRVGEEGKTTSTYDGYRQSRGTLSWQEMHWHHDGAR